MLRYLLDRYFIRQPRLRSAITKMVYGNKDCEINLFGTQFWINSLRENGYLRAAKKAKLSSLLDDEVGALISLAAILRPGDTFVDVGANVGLFSCVLSRVNQLPHTKVRFYAYEPHPDTFRRLKSNAELAGVIARNVAVSNNEGEVEFVDGAVSHVFTRVDQASSYNNPSSKYRVKTVRLGSEAIEGDSIIIKIDVEGQEWAALQGAQDLFEARRVKGVFLDGYRDKDEVEQFLKKHGFAFHSGRSIAPLQGRNFSLLAIHPEKFFLAGQAKS